MTKPPTRRKPIKAAARRPRVPVLVILNADGFVEIYGPREVNVHFALRVHTDPEEEILADDYLDTTLPKRFRELHFPVNLRGMGLCEKRSAKDELQRRLDLAFVEEVRKLGAAARGGAVPAAIAKARRATR